MTNAKVCTKCNASNVCILNPSKRKCIVRIDVTCVCVRRRKDVHVSLLNQYLGQWRSRWPHTCPLWCTWRVAINCEQSRQHALQFARATRNCCKLALPKRERIERLKARPAKGNYIRTNYKSARFNLPCSVRSEREHRQRFYLENKSNSRVYAGTWNNLSRSIEISLGNTQPVIGWRNRAPCVHGPSPFCFQSVYRASLRALDRARIRFSPAVGARAEPILRHLRQSGYCRDAGRLEREKIREGGGENSRDGSEAISSDRVLSNIYQPRRFPSRIFLIASTVKFL